MPDYTLGTLSIFHFRCAMCGYQPPERSLREYLETWHKPAPEKLTGFLGAMIAAIAEYGSKGRRRGVTKRLLQSVARVEKRVRDLGLPKETLEGAALTQVVSNGVEFLRTCPLCDIGPGVRLMDNYFTVWSEACLVQLANLLYEANLILWSVLGSLPEWATGACLQKLNAVRAGLQKAAEATNLLECPQCGRHTSCLSGGNEAYPEQGCRWCYDNCGLGLGALLRHTIELDPTEGEWWQSMNPPDQAEPEEPSPSSPAKSAKDILPPSRRRKSRKRSDQGERS